MEQKEAIKRFFKVFEVVASLVVINFMVVLGSVLTLFVLTPVLLYGAFYVTNKILILDVETLIADFIRAITSGFWNATKYGYPLLLGIGMLLGLFLGVNPLIVTEIPITLYGVILGAQLLLLYILLSLLLLHLGSLVMNNGQQTSFEIALITIFAYPIRTTIAFLSLFVIPGFLLQITPYFLFVIILIGLQGYFIVMRNAFTTMDSR